MKRIVIVAALESEYFTIQGPIKKIYYTGIGKINSARVTTELIFETKPDLILNVGTAGCLQKELLGQVFGINEVIERDMIAEPLAPRGMVPLSNQLPRLKSSFGTACCATGDSFVTSRDQWLLDNQVDLVDMELFAIAKVAAHYGIEWKSVKFASDLADENAFVQWNHSLKETNMKVSEMIEAILLGS
jgi:adenosylhomocysteine nucleosidase